MLFTTALILGATVTWDSNLTLSEGRRAWEPSIAVDALGRIAVAWSEQSGPQVEPGIYAATSQDGGKTFSFPQLLFDRYGPDMTLTADSLGNIYALWQISVRSLFQFDLYATLTDDGGKTWTEPVTVGCPASTCPGYTNDRAWLSSGGDGYVYLTVTDRLRFPVARGLYRAPAGTLNFSMLDPTGIPAPSGPVQVSARGEIYAVTVHSNALSIVHGSDGLHWITEPVIEDCSGCTALELTLTDAGFMLAYRRGISLHIVRLENGQQIDFVVPNPGSALVERRPEAWFVGNVTGIGHLLWLARDVVSNSLDMYSLSWRRCDVLNELVPARVSDVSFCTAAPVLFGDFVQLSTVGNEA